MQDWKSIDMESIMNKAKMDVGLKLKERRETLGLSVSEISEISKISRQTIYSAEDGVSYSKKYVDFLSSYNNI